ncbi:hypothetical protein BGX24_004036 [Mortierella sp. AD032]|nr:hypothetical protein BGX24_004036 [Mortierella sp. AD032]
MGHNELLWIKARTAEGLDWKAIKSRLRLDKKTLDKLEEEQTRGPMPPCMYMTQGDVQTAAYRIKTQDSRLALDPSLSVKLWLDRIQQEGGKTMFIDQVPEFEHLFADEIKDVRKALNALRHANSEAELMQQWVLFQRSFSTHTALIRYIDNQWMKPEKLVRWVLYHRENYQHINTNNLVESWHKTLKRQHLGYERDLRGDDLIHLLQGVVEIDFRTLHFKAVHGLEPMVLSEYDRGVKAKAMKLQFEHAKNMVTEIMEDGKVVLCYFG